MKNEKNHMMTRSYILACWVMTLLSLLQILSSTSSIYAQNLSGQTEKWLVPLDRGNKLMIQCYNASLVDFVSDCSSPNTCQSLWLSGNDTLECIPSSESNILGDQNYIP